MDWKSFDAVLSRVRAMGVIKNKVYGDNSLKAFGSVGILARIHDKISRIENLYKKNDEKAIINELEDIINYSVYYIVLKENKTKEICKI